MSESLSRPRIVRVTVTRADGSRRWRLVKCPYSERSPHDSLYGLTAKLAELTLDGILVASAIRVPLTITPRARERLIRWPAAIEEMVG